MSDFKFHTPNSWILSSLPDIAGINMGQSPSSSDVNEQGEGIVFFQGKAEFGKLYPTPRKYCTKPTKIASVGDILLSIRAPVGPTNIATETTAIGRGLAAISAHCGLTDPKYLLYYFRCIEPWLSTQGTGSTFKAISGQFIKELKAPLPSFAEQKIIAEKLDTLLAQVDSTKARLEQIPQILKRFRQAVLAMALNESSEQSRNPAKIVKLIDVTKKITDGEHLTPKTINSGIPLLSAKDVQEDELLFDNVKYLSDTIAAKALNRCKPEKNDILIVSRGATVGRTHLVSTSKTFCLMGSVLLIKLDTEQVVPEYMKLIFNDISGQQQLVSASGATAQQAIYIRDVKEFSFELISLHEQHEIVRRVEQLFAYADTIEKQVNNSLTRVNNLTQSILAKAFRGELTAQWRAENPDLISGENSAAALLEKIKAERATSDGKKTSRKKS
ncbi:restriction endonuclease subunit S [Salmonella enterica]|nr:4'-phosphopantetheinyl transferase [Salmonella enterica]ECF6066456.1 4'-phosphopantetheinyl transferase [Salmonella enterica subsp. diarizonae]EDQ4423822.1 4'-phosphopantetheinyl transferase [Salmonella enterica subsp. salamae]EDQ7377959.1 4'-phosphopantetheinyl transferase [Salmonella enterica subsp. diarizonae serovar 35:l,v:z35]HAE6202806.1 4'-phosphopantetheinyl transferase [Salmonella enterica subsp. diarizonae serovar 50:l,v:z35]HCA3615354.1 restriction endonuclease subunit S [Salmone